MFLHTSVFQYRVLLRPGTTSSLNLPDKSQYIYENLSHMTLSSMASPDCSSSGELWASLALFSDFSGTSYMALALVTLQMQRSGMPKSTEHCNLPGMSYSNDKALTDEPLGTKNLELRFLLCYFKPLPFQLYNRVDGLPWWILAL